MSISKTNKIVALGSACLLSFTLFGLAGCADNSSSTDTTSPSKKTEMNKNIDEKKEDKVKETNTDVAFKNQTIIAQVEAIDGNDVTFELVKSRGDKKNREEMTSDKDNSNNVEDKESKTFDKKSDNQSEDSENSVKGKERGNKDSSDTDNQSDVNLVSFTVSDTSNDEVIENANEPEKRTFDKRDKNENIDDENENIIDNGEKSSNKDASAPKDNGDKKSFNKGNRDFTLNLCDEWVDEIEVGDFVKLTFDENGEVTDFEVVDEDDIAAMKQSRKSADNENIESNDNENDSDSVKETERKGNKKNDNSVNDTLDYSQAEIA